MTTPTPPSPVIYGDPSPNYYSTALAQLISTYTDLVNKVQTQNNELDKEIQNFSQMHSTDYTKSLYENQSTEYLNNIYIYLFYIYAFLTLIVIFIMIFKKKIMEINYAILAILLILFPFFIYPVEKFIYSFLVYIYKIFTGQVFTNVYINDY